MNAQYITLTARSTKTLETDGDSVMFIEHGAVRLDYKSESGIRTQQFLSKDDGAIYLSGDVVYYVVNQRMSRTAVLLLVTA